MPHEFRIKRTVEFSDTDQAGIMHFSRFFIYMESAEHQFLRTLGTSVSTQIDGNLIGWPRLSASCEYLRPLRFEDEVEIHLFVQRKGVKSLTYRFVFRKDDEVVARGQTAAACCVCNPGEPLRAIPIPQVISDQIEEAPVE